jgi:hypothetical protein
MKLSEKYLERISASTEFSKPVVLTKNVELYGDICRLEGMMSEAKSHSRKRQLEKILGRIAKNNNLQ